MSIRVIHLIEMFHGVGLSVFIQCSNFHNHFGVMGPQNYLGSTKPGSCTRIFLIFLQFEDISKETKSRAEGKSMECNIENHNNGNLQKNVNN